LDHWSEDKALTAQMAVAEIVTKTFERCEIMSKGDTPKLMRCSLNMEIFREIVGVLKPGMQYFRRLQETHQAAWWNVGGAKKLARRLLIDGEATLRSTFLAAYEHSGHDVTKMTFIETSIGSDYAKVEEKLALALPKLAEAAAGIDAAAAANSAEPAAATAAEVAAKRAADAAAAAEAALKKAAEDAAAHERRRKEEAAKRKSEEEAAEVAAVRNETRIAMDDVMTLFDNAPRPGCLAPEQVKAASWVVFVIPVQSYIRGRPKKAMPSFQTKHLQELQWATARDMILVGCGHDPSGFQNVTSKLKQFDAVKSYSWSPLVPVVQARARRKHYIEYVLQGVGPECPCNDLPCFVQAKRGYPSTKLR